MAGQAERPEPHWLRTRWSPRHRPSPGQTSAEYLGLIVVVAAIIAALVLSPIAPLVSGGLGSAICTITGGNSCGNATTASGTPSTGSGSTAPGGAGPSGENASGQNASDQNTSGQNASGQNGDQAPAKKCGNPFTCTMDFLGSAGYNIGKGAVDDVKGLGDLVTHPGSVLDAGKYIVTHPLTAARQLVVDDETKKLWSDGDHGGATGRTVWNIGSWFIPFYDIGKGASKLGKLGKLGEAGVDAEKLAQLEKVAALATDSDKAASKAEKAAAAGDHAAAEAAAEDARKAAAEAKGRAQKLGCPLALAPLLLHTGGAVHGLPATPALAVPVIAADPACGDAANEARKADDAAKRAELAADPSMTKGALGKDFTPSVNDPAGGFTKEEKAIADYLADQGARVDHRIADHASGDKNPDSMVRWSPEDPGTITEFKTLKKPTSTVVKNDLSAAVKNDLLAAAKQSPDRSVVVDGRSAGLTRTTAQQGWKRAVGQANAHGQVLPTHAKVILDDGTVIEFTGGTP